MHIEVDPALLEGTAANLEQALAVATQVADAGGRLVSLGNGCGPAVAGDVEGFLSRWDYGMGLIAKDAESLAKMLREGAGSYRKVESSIAKGFS